MDTIASTCVRACVLDATVSIGPYLNHTLFDDGRKRDNDEYAIQLGLKATENFP